MQFDNIEENWFQQTVNFVEKVYHQKSIILEFGHFLAWIYSICDDPSDKLKCKKTLCINKSCNLLKENWFQETVKFQVLGKSWRTSYNSTYFLIKIYNTQKVTEVTSQQNISWCLFSRQTQQTLKTSQNQIEKIVSYLKRRIKICLTQLCFKSK